jgi:hypothetical protein
MCDLPAGADRTWLGPYSTARDRIVLGSKRSSVRRKQQAAAAGKSSRSGSHIKFYPGWNCRPGARIQVKSSSYQRSSVIGRARMQAAPAAMQAASHVAESAPRVPRRSQWWLLL